MLSLIDSRRFHPCVSVPLVLEYEAATKRLCRKGGLSRATVDTILDYICRVSSHHKIHYLWRPFLRDPKDDMVLELAVAAQAEWIVTYNRDDFAGTKELGIGILDPAGLLKMIGDRP